MRNYRRIKPSIAAVEPAIVARQKTTTVAESYPALLDLVQAQADQAG